MAWVAGVHGKIIVREGKGDELSGDDGQGRKFLQLLIFRYIRFICQQEESEEVVSNWIIKNC